MTHRSSLGGTARHENAQMEKGRPERASLSSERSTRYRWQPPSAASQLLSGGTIVPCTVRTWVVAP